MEKFVENIIKLNEKEKNEHNFQRNELFSTFQPHPHTPREQVRVDRGVVPERNF